MNGEEIVSEGGKCLHYVVMFAGSMTGGVLELQLSRGYDLVPKDFNGFSDPYVLVKYGSRIVFRSKVVKKSLNPEWNQVASLAAPSPEDVILVVS